MEKILNVKHTKNFLLYIQGQPGCGKTTSLLNLIKKKRLQNHKIYYLNVTYLRNEYDLSKIIQISKNHMSSKDPCFEDYFIIDDINQLQTLEPKEIQQVFKSILTINQNIRVIAISNSYHSKYFFMQNCKTGLTIKRLKYEKDQFQKFIKVNYSYLNSKDTKYILQHHSNLRQATKAILARSYEVGPDGVDIGMKTQSNSIIKNAITSRIHIQIIDRLPTIQEKAQIKHILEKVCSGTGSWIPFKSASSTKTQFSLLNKLLQKDFIIRQEEDNSLGLRFVNLETLRAAEYIVEDTCRYNPFLA